MHLSLPRRRISFSRAVPTPSCHFQAASYFGWPVSTTHSIVGALVGFGLFFGGVDAVHWASLGTVVSSWQVSPLLGATLSFIVYRCIRQVLTRSEVAL